MPRSYDLAERPSEMVCVARNFANATVFSKSTSISLQIGSNCDPSSVSRTGDDEDRSKSLPPIECSSR